MSLKIAMGGDHAGYDLKSILIEKIEREGHQVKDFGPFSGDAVDYPDYIHPLANAINTGEYKYGIIFCGSGNGAQMTANKYQNVRAALCLNEDQAKLAHEHNNANIISLPGKFIPFEQAWKIVQAFFSASFEGGRHKRRIDKISQKLK